MIRLAIYCVTYNSYDELQRYLQSVKEAALRVGQSVGVDVFVADNTEHHVQSISEAWVGFTLKVFQLKHNWGYFGAVQKMMRTTDVMAYDFVMISNVDLLLSADAFEKLTALHVDDHTGWIAPQIYSEAEDRDKNPKIKQRYTLGRLKMLRLMYAFPILHFLYTKTFYKRKKLERKTMSNGRQVIYAGHGSFIILTRAYMQKCGIPDYPVFLFGEEIYLAEKCRQGGLDVVYDPSVKIYDTEHASTGSLAKRRYYRYNKEAMEYIIHTFYSKM